MVLCVGWFGKRVWRNSQKADGVNVRQSAAPVMTANPTVNIYPPAPAPKTTFQQAQERNRIDPKEAEERRLNQLERELHTRIVEVKLIHTNDPVEYAEEMSEAVEGIRGFFMTFPELRYLNVEILKPLLGPEFDRETRETASYVWRKVESSRADLEHPCEALVNAMVEHLLKLRVRSSRTIREFENSLPK